MAAAYPGGPRGCNGASPLPGRGRRGKRPSETKGSWMSAGPQQTSPGPSVWESLGYLPFALRRRFLRPRLPDPLPEVWVVSPGGVGTTALMRHLERFRRINARDDSDGMKHLSRPPQLPVGADVRFLFISGPGQDVAQSLARRGWLEDQAANLGAPLAVVLRGRVQRRLFLRAVARQHAAWTGVSRPDVLHLDYDALWDAAPQLAEFLGIADPAFVAEFPVRRSRSAQTTG